MFYFDDIGNIFVGYELTTYTTSESMGQVAICAVLVQPGPTFAVQPFVLAVTTESGTASMLLLACYTV